MKLVQGTVLTGEHFHSAKALKNDVTLFQRLPRGRSNRVSSLQPKAWQGWDLEYACRLCNPSSCPGKPVSQEPRQLTSLHRLQVPLPAFKSAVCLQVDKSDQNSPQTNSGIILSKNLVI